MSTLILPTPAQPSDTRHPRIGYRCLAENAGAVISSDSTATGTAAKNVFNWNVYSYWKPAATGTHHIRVVLTAPGRADYFAIAQHNIGTNGGTIALQYSLDGGSTWNDAVPAFSPVGSESLWFDFAEVEADHWQIVVTSDPASVLGVVAFGLKYLPYRGQWSGFTPPGLARSFTLYASTSDAGLMLGRSVLRRQLKGSIAFNLMELSDAYSDWQPFMRGAEKHPFFLVWMLADWPEDVQYVQTDGDWSPPGMTEFGFMGTTLKYQGLLLE